MNQSYFKTNNKVHMQNYQNWFVNQFLSSLLKKIHKGLYKGQHFFTNEMVLQLLTAFGQVAKQQLLSPSLQPPAGTPLVAHVEKKKS